MGMFHYMKFERAEKLSPQKKKKKNLLSLPFQIILIEKEIILMGKVINKASGYIRRSAVNQVI